MKNTIIFEVSRPTIIHYYLLCILYYLLQRGESGRQGAVPTGDADGRVPSLRETRTAGCRPYTLVEIPVENLWITVENPRFFRCNPLIFFQFFVTTRQKTDKKPDGSSAATLRARLVFVKYPVSSAWDSNSFPVLPGCFPVQTRKKTPFFFQTRVRKPRKNKAFSPRSRSRRACVEIGLGIGIDIDIVLGIGIWIEIDIGKEIDFLFVERKIPASIPPPP